MPTRIRSCSVHPCTIAPCPIVTSSPIVVGCVPRMTCTIVPSWMLLRRPMRIRCTSPRITTFIQTLLASPISTSPMTCALSSTYAVGCTAGRRPL